MFASLFAVPIGLKLGLRTDLKAKRWYPFFSTLAGLPPVLAGITIFLLLSNIGPLGSFQWLYTPSAIVMAQILLVIPLMVSTLLPSVNNIAFDFIETCNGLHIDGLKRYRFLLREIQTTLVLAFLLGFGRAISEVGAVMMVGGNIRFKTRVMTTAIVLETNQGNYETALVLGLSLLLISWTLQSLAHGFLKEQNHV